MLSNRLLQTLLKLDYADRVAPPSELPLFDLTKPIPKDAWSPKSDAVLELRPEVDGMEFVLLDPPTTLEPFFSFGPLSRARVRPSQLGHQKSADGKECARCLQPLGEGSLEGPCPTLERESFESSVDELSQRPLLTAEAIRKAAELEVPFLNKAPLPDNVFLCGGAAERILSRALTLTLQAKTQNSNAPPPAKKMRRDSGGSKQKPQPVDVDLFFVGDPAREDSTSVATQTLIQYAGVLAEKVKTPSREPHGVDLLWQRGHVVDMPLVGSQFGDVVGLQFVLRLYENLAQVLNGFDFGSCQVGYDGKTLWVTRLGLHARLTGMNLVDSQRRSVSYEYRLRKYVERGYGLALPKLLVLETGPCELISRAVKVVAERKSVGDDPWKVSVASSKREFPLVPLSDYAVLDMMKNGNFPCEMISPETQANVANSRIARASLILAAATPESAANYSPEALIAKLQAFAEVSGEASKRGTVFRVVTNFESPSATCTHFLTQVMRAEDLGSKIFAAIGPVEPQRSDSFFQLVDSHGISIDSAFFERHLACCQRLKEYLDKNAPITRTLPWVTTNPASQVLLSSSFNPCFSTYQEYALDRAAPIERVVQVDRGLKAKTSE